LRFDLFVSLSTIVQNMKVKKMSADEEIDRSDKFVKDFSGMVVEKKGTGRTLKQMMKDAKIANEVEDILTGTNEDQI